MEIKKVSVFESSDGHLHKDKIKFLNHQHLLDLRGLLNKAYQDAGLRTGAITIVDAAGLIAQNEEKLSKIIADYRLALNRAIGEQKRTNGTLRLVAA